MTWNLTNNGDTPHLIRGEQTDFKRLFYSNPQVALTVPIALMAGYGLLEAGTSLAVNKSASGKAGYYLPYNPTTFTGTEDHPGRAYLVQSSGTTASTLYVTIADSYKFNVGDDAIIKDNTTAAENLGAITAIDRTTYSHMAAITVTTATGGTSFTTARFAYICVEAGDSSNNYSDCVGVLLAAVDTGTGANAKGGQGVLLLGNAVLYDGMLVNVDAAAKTDISMSTLGKYAYVK